MRAMPAGAWHRPVRPSPDASRVVLREQGSCGRAQIPSEEFRIHACVVEQHRNELIYFVQEQLEAPGIPQS